jgi:NAD(P)-dependent dehydrogenase (short-subunit alcohol dehydrogenase family)
MKRTALVTGGSRGIGFGIATALAAEGFDLAICGVREEKEVAEPLAALRAKNVNVLYCACDIGDADSRKRMLETIRERFGRLNLLVNNAGVAPKVRADILDATEESFEWVLKVNLQAPYFLTQSAAKWMIELRRADPDFPACIINISSISATTASPNRGDYCISKAGIGMATKLWAVRLADFGIPVYEVRPGIIRTDMTSGVVEKYDKLIGQGILLQPRWGQPEDVGKAVASLARGDFPYSTGQVVAVDGGFGIERL